MPDHQDRPSLTTALASVLVARVDGDRRELLRTMSAAAPDGVQQPPRTAPTRALVAVPNLATVTPLARVLPMPRRAPDAARDMDRDMERDMDRDREPDPTSAA